MEGEDRTIEPKTLEKQTDAEDLGAEADKDRGEGRTRGANIWRDWPMAGDEDRCKERQHLRNPRRDVYMQLVLEHSSEVPDIPVNIPANPVTCNMQHATCSSNMQHAICNKCNTA